MTLTKNQFIEHTAHLEVMLHQINDISACLNTDNTIMDNWFDNYYNLVDELCELDHGYYDSLEEGSPLDFWLFGSRDEEGNRKPYKDNVTFYFIDDVYNYIIDNNHSEVKGA